MEEKRKSKESERLNASLISSLRILDYLGDIERSAPLAELRKTLQLNKSRVMRLCGTLMHMGYLKYEPEAGLYSLGPRLLSLGKVYERQTPLIETIRPVLRYLVEQLEETASFQILRGDRRLCLCAVESPHQVRYTMNEGSEAGYPYGSIWKVIMAWGPSGLYDRILAEAPFVPETPYTIVTREELEKVVHQTRELGYCYTNGDHNVGSSAVAVPVMETDSRLLGVICISGVSERMDTVFIRKAVPMLKEQADLLSVTLKGRTF